MHNPLQNANEISSGASRRPSSFFYLGRQHATNKIADTTDFVQIHQIDGRARPVAVISLCKRKRAKSLMMRAKVGQEIKGCWLHKKQKKKWLIEELYARQR